MALLEVWEGNRVRCGEGGEREWRKWEGSGSGEVWEGDRVQLAVGEGSEIGGSVREEGVGKCGRGTE